MLTNSSDTYICMYDSYFATFAETKHASGMVFFVAGVLSVILLFPKKVCTYTKYIHLYIYITYVCVLKIHTDGTNASTID